MTTIYQQRAPAPPEEPLRRLVRQGVITEAQAAAVRAAQAEAPAPEPASAVGRWWAEVAGYLGGVLVLGAGGILLATTWDQLTDLSRGGLLVAITVALVAGALVLAGGPTRLIRLARGEAPARRRVVGVLFALASASAAGAAGVLAQDHASMAAFTAGMLVAVAGYAVLPTVPGLLASAGMSMLLASSTVGELSNADSPFPLGLTFLTLGVIWGSLAATAAIAPRQVGLGLGAAIALLGAQLLFGEPGGPAWAYGSTFAIALVSFALYRWRRDVVLLTAGVVAAAIAAPEAIWDWTDGAAGGAFVLLAAGVALIGASGLGLGLWRSHD